MKVECVREQKRSSHTHKHTLVRREESNNLKSVQLIKILRACLGAGLTAHRHLPLLLFGTAGPAIDGPDSKWWVLFRTAKRNTSETGYMRMYTLKRRHYIYPEERNLFLLFCSALFCAVPQDAGAKIALTIIYNGIKASSYSNNVVYNTVLCV